MEKDYLYRDSLLLDSEAAAEGIGPQYALLEFQSPVTCNTSALVIGSDFSTDIHANTVRRRCSCSTDLLQCRLAFHGRLNLFTSDADFKTSFLPTIKIYKDKVREGQVERLHDDYTVVGKGLFKKETQMDKFTGLAVSLSTGEEGVLESSFGQSGKFKVRVPNGLKPETLAMLAHTKKGKSKKAKAVAAPTEGTDDPIIIYLKFKRYIFDAEKAMRQ